MRWTAVSILALFAVYWIAATAGPEAVGAWQDDAIYLVTARSLAEGNGYRLMHIPGQPRQTKYPILYPAILALVHPRYPQNLWLLLAPGAAAAAGFVVLSGVIVRRLLGGSRGMAIAVGVLAAASPQILCQVRFTMSDMTFAFLSVAALLCLDGKYASAPTAWRGRLWLVVAALLIAAAALTRTFGLALLAAAVAGLLLRRRFAAAAATLGIVAACLLPWYLWRHWAAGCNGAIQTSPLDAYALDYWLWAPRRLPDFVRVGAYNALKTVFAACYVQLALPRSWVVAALSTVSWRLVALHLACYATAALVIAGFVGTFCRQQAAGPAGLVSAFRRNCRTFHLYAAGYLAMMLLWPFDPSRFLDCWIPFILYFLLSGARLAGRACLPAESANPASQPSTVRNRKLLILVPAVICFAIVVLFIHEDLNILGSTRGDYSFLRQSVDLTESDSLKEWLRANTAPGDVLASNHAAELYLATGRQGHDFASWSNPAAAYYGHDRQWWRFFMVHAPSEYQWLYDWAGPELERAYRQAGVTYYIDDAGHPMAVVMRRFLERHPRLFQLSFQTGKTYSVYRFTPTDSTTTP